MRFFSAFAPLYYADEDGTSFSVHFLHTLEKSAEDYLILFEK